MGDEESGGNSVATSCPSALINWWDVHATSPSSWNSHHHPAAANPNSNEDHDISLSTSFSNSSNQSNSFMPEQPSDNHLWTHVLLGVGSNEELQNSQGGGENLMDALSSKSIMYEEPACNYLKKLDNNNSSSINTSFDHHHRQLNGFNGEAVLESERLSKLVTTWSIAPPDPQAFYHDQNNTVTIDHSGLFSSYAALDHMKVKQEHHHHHASDQAPPQGGLFGYQNNNGFNSTHHQYGMVPSLSSSCSRNLTDVISFTGRIGRPIIGIHHALKPTFRPTLTTVSDSKKQLFHTSLPTRTSNGRGQGSSTEVKKKRTDDSSEAISKKPKQETSTASSNTKVQAPKVKLGDRITTLQQIVSPFGKTDTASVLFEAIGYIKFLQEQVQLLSNSYMKTNSQMQETWGSMERREEKGDLKSRGLCLVPISWTPQAYRDNTAPDYWTPAYRGCLFR